MLTRTYHFTKRGMMRRHIKCRVHQQAPFPVAIIERAFHDLLEEGLDRSERRRRLTAPDSVSDAPFDVVIQCLLLARALVSKGV
jgi:hypothetical protein